MSGSEDQVRIQSFSGLNTFLPASRVANEELTELENFTVGLAGELRRRTGFTMIDSVGAYQVKILGTLVTASLTHWLVYYNGHVWSTPDFVAYTDRGAYAGVYGGVQYADEFYIFRTSGTLLKYTGAALTTIAGSPMGTNASVFKDRLFILNTESSTLASRLYFSEAGDFTTWPAINFIDVNFGDGDLLTACHPYQDRLIIFKALTTWALYVQGDPTSWVLRVLNNEIGCSSGYGVIEVVGVLYLAAVRGVYRTDGITFEEVSRAIRPAFHDRLSELTSLNLDHVARWEDSLIWRITKADGNGEYYCLNFRTGGWAYWTLSGGLEPEFFFTSLIGDPGVYSGCHGLDGHILRFGDEVYMDDMVEYTSRAVTKHFDFDKPEAMKRGKVLLPEIKGAGDTTIRYVLEAVEDLAHDQVIVGSNDKLQAFRVTGPGYFRSCAVVLENDNDGEFYLTGWTMLTHFKRGYPT